MTRTSRQEGLFGKQTGVSIPALKGKQGKRTMYLCLPPNAVIKNFFPKDSEVPEALKSQRAYDEGRAEEIRDYVVENPDDFVLGALTYAMDTPAEFEPAEPGAPIGLLTIPLSATLRCVDGQHRRGALRLAIDGLKDLASQQTAMIIYVEGDLEARRQMFSDMNWHQKPVSKSVNVSFDQRDPFARATQEISRTHPLLKGRVEEEKSTVKRGSDKLFTMGAVYDALGRLCTGAGGRLRDKSKYGTDKELADLGTEFFDLLVEARPEFKGVVEGMQPPPAPESSILFSSTTLKMLASAVHVVRAKRGMKRLGRLRESLAKIDFSPGAKMWAESGFVTPGKSTPNARLQEIKGAADLVAEALLSDFHAEAKKAAAPARG
jgi:DGQHR domain-containing protein